MSEVVSRLLTKGWRVGCGEVGKGLDLKMEANHNWSPETRLQGTLVVDM